MKGHRRDDDGTYTICEISRIIRGKHDLPSQYSKLAVRNPNDCVRFEGQTRCKASSYLLAYLHNKAMNIRSLMFLLLLLTLTTNTRYYIFLMPATIANVHFPTTCYPGYIFLISATISMFF